jgi:hypothetical protein
MAHSTSNTGHPKKHLRLCFESMLVLLIFILISPARLPAQNEKYKFDFIGDSHWSK